MLSKKMTKALGDQITAELASAYLYLSMSAYFHSINLEGCAHWMRTQAAEELAHAMKFYDFVNERGGRVVLQPLEAPPKEWPAPKAVFEATYQHEQKVTAMIHRLVELAAQERDHATGIFLQWFVTEQVEEESAALEIVQKFQMIGTTGSMLYLLDRELAKRGTSGS